MITENYLDPDVAYLLGLITIRGELYESQGDKRIIIQFPFKSLIAEGIKIHVDQRDQLDMAVNRIRDRLQELVESPIDVERGEKEIVFSMRFLRNSLMWRNIRYMLGTKRSFREFEIPRSILEAPDDVIKIEFLRGVADAGGFVRQSNYYLNGKNRVYIEVNNRNWKLPTQLCRLMQVDLDVPVQIIQWGHPNVRQPHKKEGTAWAKEHQVKIFVEEFAKIGFYVPYKEKILKELVEADRKVGGKKPPKCNPNPEIRRIKKKPEHPGEKSNIVPKKLRKHFNAYWQICLALGCDQCVETDQLSLIEIYPDDEA